MMTPTRIVRLVGITGLLCWLGMVGWMAKSTWAQNGAQPSPPAQIPTRAEQTSSAPPPIAPVTTAEPAADGSAATSAPLPPPAITSDSGSEPGLSAAVNSSPAPLATTAQEPTAGSADDPEKSAQSFVERNQKEAEAHLKALTAEAEQLRTRLTRLESGIKRWQLLVNALRSAQGAAVVNDPVMLEPIPQTGAGGLRPDKRVKWASATPTPANETEPAQPAAATEVAPSSAAPPAPVARPAPVQQITPGYAPR
jgi:hypothetical protein